MFRKIIDKVLFKDGQTYCFNRKKFGCDRDARTTSCCDNWKIFNNIFGCERKFIDRYVDASQWKRIKRHRILQLWGRRTHIQSKIHKHWIQNIRDKKDKRNKNQGGFSQVHNLHFQYDLIPSKCRELLAAGECQCDNSFCGLLYWKIGWKNNFGLCLSKIIFI